MYLAHPAISVRTFGKRGILPRTHRPQPRTTSPHSQRIDRAMTIRLEEERATFSCQQGSWNRMRPERVGHPCPTNEHDSDGRRRALTPVINADRLSRSSVQAAPVKRKRRITRARAYVKAGLHRRRLRRPRRRSKPHRDHLGRTSAAVLLPPRLSCPRRRFPRRRRGVHHERKRCSSPRSRSVQHSPSNRPQRPSLSDVTIPRGNLFRAAGAT